MSEIRPFDVSVHSFMYFRCAPECINFLRFTSQSDVWAFGVTLWEMFSYGFQPWAALTGQQILEAIDEPNLQVHTYYTSSSTGTSAHLFAPNLGNVAIYLLLRRDKLKSGTIEIQIQLTY